MTDPAVQARNRWLIISAIRLVALAGAVFAVVLIARAPSWPYRALGAAIGVSIGATTISETGSGAGLFVTVAALVLVAGIVASAAAQAARRAASAQLAPVR